jgi:hypothetical protein
LFELDKEALEKHDFGFLCNQVIHSYIFTIIENVYGGISGFLIASDTGHNKKVYYLSLTQLTDIFRTIGRDYPNKLQLERDVNSRQCRQINKRVMRENSCVKCDILFASWRVTLFCLPKIK